MLAPYPVVVRSPALAAAMDRLVLKDNKFYYARNGRRAGYLSATGDRKIGFGYESRKTWLEKDLVKFYKDWKNVSNGPRS